jgi:hypothetical protein
MKDLSNNDLEQLVLFYKNKSVDLEMSFLLEQIKHNKIIIEKNEEFEKQNKEKIAVFKYHEKMNEEKHQLEINSLKKEIEKKEKELLKLKNNK